MNLDVKFRVCQATIVLGLLTIVSVVVWTACLYLNGGPVAEFLIFWGAGVAASVLAFLAWWGFFWLAGKAGEEKAE